MLSDGVLDATANRPYAGFCIKLLRSGISPVEARYQLSRRPIVSYNLMQVSFPEKDAVPDVLGVPVCLKAEQMGAVRCIACRRWVPRRSLKSSLANSSTRPAAIAADAPGHRPAVPPMRAG
jgi:hypothetical protein